MMKNAASAASYDVLKSTISLDLAGTLIVNGTVDLKFTVYGKDREEKEMISKVDIESSGGQISGTKVRGNLLMIQN
jgi:hypothetical protein